MGAEEAQNDSEWGEEVSYQIEHKIPTAQLERQAALYAEGVFAGYRYLYNEPVLVNKLPGYKPIWRLRDIIHPETLVAMARPMPRIIW